MERDNNKQYKDSDEELYLLFIDEERNKNLEERFNSYINKYFNFDKKDKSVNSDNQYHEKRENKENIENKSEPKIFLFAIN